MAQTFFRSDQFVKSAIGPAVPGAQVYVCLQPANVTDVPPSPLADIFSDINGLVPIEQPVITDGFGHVDFYAAAGLYTHVIVLGGRIQNVYEDQLLGAGEAGPGNPYTAGANITIVGSVISAVNGSAPVTSVFGRIGDVVAVSGDYIVSQITGAAPLASPGFTGIPTAPTAAPGTATTQLATCAFVLANSGHTFNTAGQGWFLGASTYSPVIDDSGFSITGSANRVYAVQLVLQSSWTISKIGAFIITAGSAGQFFTAAVYSADGTTRLLYAGTNAFDISSNSQKYIQSSITPVTLQPGTYLFAWGATANVGSILCHQQGTWMCQLVNGISFSGGQTGTTHLAIAANSLSGGAMPSSLGALTAVDNTTVIHPPAVIFLP